MIQCIKYLFHKLYPSHFAVPVLQCRYRTDFESTYQKIKAPKKITGKSLNLLERISRVKKMQENNWDIVWIRLLHLFPGALLTLLFNQCRMSKTVLHILFSEHHVIQTAHISYCNSTGSQLTISEWKKEKNCLNVLQCNHRFCPLLSFWATAPLQSFQLSLLFTRHTHAQTPNASTVKLSQ